MHARNMATLKSVTECKYDLFYPEELHDLRNIIHSILKRLRSKKVRYRITTKKLQTKKIFRVVESKSLCLKYRCALSVAITFTLRNKAVKIDTMRG